MEVNGPIFGRVVKEDVTVNILRHHAVYIKGMGLEFREEQVSNTDLS